MDNHFDDINKSLNILKTESQLLKDISNYANEASKKIDIFAEIIANPFKLMLMPNPLDANKLQDEIFMYICLMNNSIQTLSDFSDIAKEELNNTEEGE